MIETDAAAGVNARVAAEERATLDGPAFARLFDLHYAAVFRYTVSRLGEDHGEEVAAQTFEVAWVHRHRFDPGLGDPRAWLLGVATNLIRRHRRTERRRLAAYARAADDASAPPAHEPATAAFGAAVAALPRADRDVLLLFAWADLSYDQIAQALDLPVGTVRSRLNRARRLVRAALANSDQMEAG